MLSYFAARSIKIAEIIHWKEQSLPGIYQNKTTKHYFRKIINKSLKKAGLTIYVIFDCAGICHS
jgi:preprotein translocase subunit SecY